MNVRLPGTLSPPDDIISEIHLSRALSVRVGAAFASLAELLADTRLDYTVLTAGDFISVQGFRYLVGSADATDAHLTTAGGLKLYVLTDASARLSAVAFGADPGGVSNSLDAWRTAAAAANVADTTLVGTGRFKLSGKGDVVVTTDCDFSGAVFECADWEGRFVFGRKQPVHLHVSGPVVTGLQRSSDLDVGSSRFSGWDQLREVDDSFVIITTQQEFYSYRGEIKKRLEFNRVYKDGVVASPLRYPLKGVGVTSIKVLPMEERRRQVKGLTLDIRGNDIATQFVRVSTSLLDLDVRFIQDSFAHAAKNPTFVFFFECCQVTARVQMQWTNRTSAGSGYTYNMGMEYCYDLDISPQADGDGWGATGSNLCQRITFREGTLSRIDFHQPFMEWLRLREMVVGDWGILVTALGDLDLDTVRFQARSMANVNSSGIIRSRDDTGGFCDGDLLMRNVSVVADAGSGDPLLFRHVQGASGTAKPTGSPITYRWWRRIRIDGLDYHAARRSQRLLIQPCQIAAGAARLVTCDEFTLHNAHGSGLSVDIALGSNAPARSGMLPLKVDLENVVGDTVATSSTGASALVMVSMRNCRGAQRDGIVLLIQAAGEVTVLGGCIGRLALLGQTPLTRPVKLQAFGASVVDDGGEPLLTANALCDLRLVDCTIWTSDVARLSPLLAATLERPTFRINGSPALWKISNTLIDSGTFTLVHPVRAGQPVSLLMGLTSDARTARVEFAMPSVGSRTAFVGYHESTGPAFGLVHRVDELTLELSGAVRYRVLELGRLS